MDGPVWILVFMLGGAAGSILAFLVYRLKSRAELEQARTAGEAERSTLVERLQGREGQLAEIRIALERVNAEMTGLREEQRSESERRAAAEEKNRRIPGLEATVEQRDEVISRLQGEKSDITARLSESETRLVEERKAAEEKLALIHEAERKLSDAFKALSAEALSGNNQSFLELANATLARFQEGARGDLLARQKAIDELVKPLPVVEKPQRLYGGDQLGRALARGEQIE